MKIKTKKRNNNSKKEQNKTKRNQKGGIRVAKTNVSHDEAFKYFIENSTFSYYSRGFFGVLVLATLKDGIQSPYRHIRTNSIAHVKHLLIKLFEIKPNVDPDIEPIDIQAEVNIQQTIYISSLTDKDTLLEPICPSIVYSHSDPLSYSYKQSFYNLMNQTLQNNKQVDNVFEGDVAFFAMEFMENYSPLSKFRDNYFKSTYINRALYTLDKMHSLGFMHNDFHDNNVLIVENYNYFGFGQGIVNGRAIIIDFGRATDFEFPVIIDNNYRMNLLQQESNDAHQGVFYIFKKFDEDHKIVQNRYIEILEHFYKCDIFKIINSYKIYIGGNMSIPKESKAKPVKYIRKDEKINGETTEEYFKRVNPEKYYELINSINDTLEEEKRTPGYINALFGNQFNGLIDPAFKLTIDNDNDPNKLRLIMD